MLLDFLYLKKAIPILTFAIPILTFAMNWARQIQNVMHLYVFDLEDILFLGDLLYTLEVYLF